MEVETMGFIGLGVMGRPMALNLLQAGYALVVQSRPVAASTELADLGAEIAQTPREVAERSTVTITMLPDSPQVVEVAQGVLAGASPGQLLIDMSTISPVVSQQLADRAREKRVDMLDAPVSGGDVGAQQGTLSIMVGGDKAAFERARPIFDVLGGTVIRVGDSGAGQVAKACNQIVVALVIEAVSEALVLGSKAGVDPEVIMRVLSGGLAANKVMEVRGRNFLEHDFKPGFKIDLHHKDLGIALATARSHGVSLPVTAIVDQFLSVLRQRGYGTADHSALLTVIEEFAHHTIGTGADGGNLA